jgi:antitoxin component YwqK of YwqJK toxin-antitoxin module
MSAEVFREWYKNGNIKKQYWLLGNKLHGILQSFYLNGRPKAYLNYAHGKLDGSQKYFHQNGEVAKIVEYVNGKKNGECKKYGIETAVQCEYLNNKLHGRKIFVDSKNVTDCFYVNGKLNGPWISSNNITGLTEKGNYLNNKKEGTWEVEKIVSVNKKSVKVSPVQKLNYKNGTLHGECIEYVGGNVRGVSFYKDGLRHGEFTLYYGDGQIEVKAVYRNNKVISWNKYGPDGVLKPSKP